MQLPDLTSELALGKELPPVAINHAVEALLDPILEVERKAEFLGALTAKGETAGEIAGFALALRRHALPVRNTDDWWLHSDVLDVCGTGGDRLNTFNISTTVALVCAAAGVVVAKHGNRAITSQSGSADVLEALGIRTDLLPAEAARWLRDYRFAFLFAPHFHPGFRHIGPARKLCAQRGQRTIFNLLGPLLNPALPTVQLVGISSPHLTQAIAEALQQIGIRRAMVVSGMAGSTSEAGWFDELSTLGENQISEFYQDRAINSSIWHAHDLPLQSSSLEHLAGGDKIVNARIVEAILRGHERGPKRDAVLLNAGAALMLAGRARTIGDGWEIARETLESGLAGAKLDQLRQAASTSMGQ
ncbi:MAG TPA: anthranilate phosphoribosyltransferase [Candidatus Limnocylindria bacterium]|nr:anthranilate phosphoribosyltransferase [Candidatus Limnocylindria bacterium]